MLDDVEVDFVETEEEFEDDGPEAGPAAMLRMDVDGDETSVVVSWTDRADLDRLATSLVDLMTGRYLDAVISTIGTYGGFVGDVESARLLIDALRKRMAPHLAAKSDRPLVSPRMAIPMLMRRGSE